MTDDSCFFQLAGNTCQTWINKERGDVCWLNQTSQTSFSTLWISFYLVIVLFNVVHVQLNESSVILQH